MEGYSMFSSFPPVQKRQGDVNWCFRRRIHKPGRTRQNCPFMMMKATVTVFSPWWEKGKEDGLLILKSFWSIGCRILHMQDIGRWGGRWKNSSKCVCKNDPANAKRSPVLDSSFTELDIHISTGLGSPELSYEHIESKNSRYFLPMKRYSKRKNYIISPVL